MSLKSMLHRLAIDHAVKSERGFKPSKKLKGGITIYQHSMSILVGLLVLNARKSGILDAERVMLIDRVAARYSEHVMYTGHETMTTIEVVADMDGDYDMRGAFGFETPLNEMLRTIRHDLPEIARKEMVAHVALFLRLDPIQTDMDERTARLRDEYGRLMGSVTSANVEEVLNQAAGYMIEW
jgi:hypothetical protein